MLVYALFYAERTVPSARVTVCPLKLIVPLFVREVRVQSPVRFQTAPLSTVTTALFETAEPPCAFSVMLIIPVKTLPAERVMSRVEILSTSITPESVWFSALKVT